MENKRIKREIQTLTRMITLYCNAKHLTFPNTLCHDCKELLSYAIQKTKKCSFGENKPICSACQIHCYTKINREKIKTVMRYSGPRMIYHSPYLAIMHFIDKINNKHRT